VETGVGLPKLTAYEKIDYFIFTITIIAKPMPKKIRLVKKWFRLNNPGKFFYPRMEKEVGDVAGV